MTTTIKLFGGSFGDDNMFVRCDLSQASAPVQVLYTLGGTEWEHTQYQCADCCHRDSGLVEIGKLLGADAIQEPQEDFECDWEYVSGFKESADTDHDDARNWYASYGWHLSTENAGDVTHDAVEFDWLDDDDDVVIDKLIEADGGISRDEADIIVARARQIREAAEAVESQLEAAIKAYEADNYSACVAALDECESIENEHGDCPASKELRSKLIDETLVDVMA